MNKYILKTVNTLVSFFEILCLCLAGLYAVYALWDNHQIYSAADDVQADMLKMKPKIEEDGGASFEELLAVNGDVCAWITLDNTNIDYVVLQGETNLSYLNMDVYGDFSLAGSIFLDSRNSSDFSDPLSVLYGHHMDKDKMFGDLDFYKEESFFKKNTTGTLISPMESYQLDIFSYLELTASDEYIYSPERWRNESLEELFNYIEENSVYIHKDTFDELRQDENPKILALTTCDAGYTEARTIILAAMKIMDSSEKY